MKFVSFRPAVEKSPFRDYVDADMLEDRYYMRGTPFQPRRSATLVLVIANAVIFLMQEALFRFAPEVAATFYGYLPLSLKGLEHGFVWQLLSYQFLHANFLHVLFNCWAIYVFGLEVENALGRKNFLTLYFLSGTIGGLVQALAGLASERFAGPVVGASAAAFGLVAAYAVLFPDRILLLFMIIPIRAKFLLLGSAVLAVVGILSSASANPAPLGVHVADAAHLGGMLTGFVFVRYALNWNWHWPQLNRRRATRRGWCGSARRARLRGAAARRTRKNFRPRNSSAKRWTRFSTRFPAHGIQSLTHRERRILEAAREKMAKR